ncbi:MAG: hypothetical protein ACOCUL_02975, partial [Bacteroidota bacterium]
GFLGLLLCWFFNMNKRGLKGGNKMKRTIFTADGKKKSRFKLTDQQVNNLHLPAKELNDEKYKSIRERYKHVQIIFKPMNQLNWTQFVRIDKYIIDLPLRPSALAIFMVHAMLSDHKKKGKHKVTLDTLSDYSGINKSSVKRANLDLLTEGLINYEKDRRTSVNVYWNVDIIRKGSETEKGEALYFWTDIVRSGIWAKLSLNAKYLYLWFLKSGKLDPHAYAEENDQEVEDHNPELFAFTDINFLNITNSDLGKIFNKFSSYQELEDTIKELDKECLIGFDSEDYSDVVLRDYRKPQNICNALEAN